MKLIISKLRIIQVMRTDAVNSGAAVLELMTENDKLKAKNVRLKQENEVLRHERANAPGRVTIVSFSGLSARTESNTELSASHERTSSYSSREGTSFSSSLSSGTSRLKQNKASSKLQFQLQNSKATSFSQSFVSRSPPYASNLLFSQIDPCTKMTVL